MLTGFLLAFNRGFFAIAGSFNLPRVRPGQTLGFHRSLPSSSGFHPIESFFQFLDLNWFELREPRFNPGPEALIENMGEKCALCTHSFIAVGEYLWQGLQYWGWWCGLYSERTKLWRRRVIRRRRMHRTG